MYCTCRCTGSTHCRRFDDSCIGFDSSMFQQKYEPNISYLQLYKSDSWCIFLYCRHRHLPADKFTSRTTYYSQQQHTFCAIALYEKILIKEPGIFQPGSLISAKVFLLFLYIFEIFCNILSIVCPSYIDWCFARFILLICHSFIYFAIFHNQLSDIIC